MENDAKKLAEENIGLLFHIANEIGRRTRQSGNEVLGDVYIHALPKLRRFDPSKSKLGRWLNASVLRSDISRSHGSRRKHKMTSHCFSDQQILDDASYDPPCLDPIPELHQDLLELIVGFLKKHSKGFLLLDTCLGEKTLTTVAAERGISLTLASLWRRQLMGDVYLFLIARGLDDGSRQTKFTPASLGAGLDSPA